MFPVYTPGTANWYKYHFLVKLVYDGEIKYLECCPQMSTGRINKSDIHMLDLNNTEDFVWCDKVA